jgi:hypothetical protein
MQLRSFVIVASLLAAAAVQAQAPAPSPEAQAAHDAFHKACATDAQTLCADKKGHEVGACLRTNSDKLSPSCKDAMAKLPKPPAH